VDHIVTTAADLDGVYRAVAAFDPMAAYSAIDSKLISPLLLAKHRAVLRQRLHDRHPAPRQRQPPPRVNRIADARSFSSAAQEVGDSGHSIERPHGANVSAMS
jgi:hypothetical protein